MKQLTFSIIFLICALFFFFNVERLDFTHDNVINIQSFVYLIGFVAVLLILLIPRFGQLPVFVSIVLFVGLYLFVKVFIANPTKAVWGGSYTYLFITELSLLILLIYLAHRLAYQLQQFKASVEDVLLPQARHYLRSVEEASEAIRTEVRRNRHYSRPMSVIVVQPDRLTSEKVSSRMLLEMQRAVLGHYTNLRVANLMRERLRDIDMVLEMEGEEGFIVFCPELDDSGSQRVTNRIKISASELGIDVNCGTAEFPKEGLSFESLVDHALNKVQESSPVKRSVGREDGSRLLRKEN